MESIQDRLHAWAEAVQPDIAYCVTCQPYDSGDYVWVLGEQSEMREVLSDHAIPEEHQETVARMLHCNGCGNEDLSIHDEVGLPDPEEVAHKARWNAWDEEYADQVADLESHLERFPYLGATHPLGLEIRKLIADLDKASVDSGSWWRARCVESARLLGPNDLSPPPRAQAKSEGRFNHFGHSAFYLAEAPELALSETLDSEHQEVLAWVQKFEVGALSRVLDLRRPEWFDGDKIPLLALGLIDHMGTRSPDRDSPWKPEYFISRYVSDCAKEAGFQSILFESSRSIGNNLVLFEWDAADIKPVGVPRIRHFEPRKTEF